MQSQYFITNDGVRLHYLSGGQGEPLVIVHGYRSEAAEYCNNLEELSKHFTVYFLEHRGHGESQRVSYGARISRLSKDLQEFISFLKLDKVNIMCHSMGCLVVWNYIDLFGQDKINKLIFVDVGTRLSVNPYESKEENERHGATFTNVWKIYTEMNLSMERGNQEFLNQAKDNPDDISAQSPYYQYSRSLPRAEQDNKFLAKLFLSIASCDVTDIVERISVPTMYVTGETSRCTNPKLTQWYREHIPGLEVTGFTREEYGRHSMFCANPRKFNQVVVDFLSKE